MGILSDADIHGDESCPDSVRSRAGGPGYDWVSRLPLMAALFGRVGN